MAQNESRSPVWDRNAAPPPNIALDPQLYHTPPHYSGPPHFPPPRMGYEQSIESPFYSSLPPPQAHQSSSSSHMSDSNQALSDRATGKRPSSGRISSEGSSRKRAKRESVSDDEDDEIDSRSVGVSPHASSSQPPQQAPPKAKATRGSRACTVCRRLKMKCVGAENGNGPCKRCIAGKHECIFEESNRGKRSSKKHEVLTNSLRKMEKTLETVMRSLNDPQQLASIVAAGGIQGLVPPETFNALSHGLRTSSRSPSPAPMNLVSDAGLIANSASIRTSSASGFHPPSAPSPSGTHQSINSSNSIQSVLAQKTENLTSRSTNVSPASPPRQTLSISTPSSHHNSRPPLSVSYERPPSSASLAAVEDGIDRRAPSPRLGSLPDNSLNPLGLLAEASLTTKGKGKGKQQDQDTAEREKLVEQALNGTINDDGEPQGPEDGVDKKVGVANETYFRPGPMNILPLRRLFIERQIQPEMLSFVTTEEVIDLFKIYFEHINVHTGLLDREFHTPSLVCSRSPFLLTVICAISSKFYTKRPEIHARLTSLSKKLSFTVPERGFKSVEVVQAYLLLSLWGFGPVERFEQDKTWILLGLAIRMSTDLNLHRKSSGLSSDSPQAEWKARERELRNRERTWLLVFTLDRSFSAQMGKPHSVLEDYIIRNVAQWWALPETKITDAGLAGYCELQRIMSRSIDFLYSSTSNTSGLQKDTDYLLVVRTIESQLDGWKTTWDFRNLSRLGTNLDLELLTDREKEYLPVMLRFYYHYNMLVVNSFGLQNALERSTVDLGHFFGQCYTSATACLLIVRDELGPLGYLRYSPDSHFVLSSYAVLTLLKLIRPEFRGLIESEERTLKLVNGVLDTLESVAVNSTHTPALYSSFLRAVVASRTQSSAPASPRANMNGGGRPSTNDPSAPHQQWSRNTNTTAADGIDGAVNSELITLGLSGDSPLNLASGPAAGVYGDEHQFGDGALGLKMFPPLLGSGGEHMAWSSAGANGVSSSEGGVESRNGNGSEMEWQNSTGSGAGQQQQQAGMDDFMDSMGGFWDNVLIPGYSSGLEGLSGGFVYANGGSGFITPRRAVSLEPGPDSLSQGSINHAFSRTA